MSIVEQVEDLRAALRQVEEQQNEDAITASPVQLRHGRDHAPDEDLGGVTRQKCGGGYRVIRKKIGGN